MPAAAPAAPHAPAAGGMAPAGGPPMGGPPMGGAAGGGAPPVGAFPPRGAPAAGGAPPPPVPPPAAAGGPPGGRPNPFASPLAGGAGMTSPPGAAGGGAFGGGGGGAPPPGGAGHHHAAGPPLAAAAAAAPAHHHAPPGPFGAGGGGGGGPGGGAAFGDPSGGGGPRGPGPLPAGAVLGHPSAPPVAPGGGGFGSPVGGGGLGGGGGSPAPAMATTNDAACCLPAYMSLTTNAVPHDAGVALKSALPFGLAVHPMAEGDGSLRGRVPVVNFGAAGIVRCKKCRAYVNPFARFVDGGRRWRCNFCYYTNDTPAPYFAPCDEAGVRVDARDRPELCTGSVEFIAPAEYMVRAPQPPVYVFVLDVSYTAVAMGVLAAACATVRAALPALAANERTQVGLVTFDSTVHFYSLRARGPDGAVRPQQLVVPDVDDLFLPVPDDLLVNLAEHAAAFDALLGALPATVAGTRCMDTALGPALEGAFQVMQHVGGKMVVACATLPTAGPGKLKPREAPRMVGGEQEHTLLAPAASDDGAVYKNKAIEFSKQQVSVDMFLFNQSYADVATLGALSRYTAGQVYHYGGGWGAAGGAADAARFAADLRRDLTRRTGFEAVMRVRASEGITINNFYGNFFIRGSDLLAMPNVTPETAFNVELAHEKPLPPGSVVAVQAALLYTTAGGERRILVHTLAKPVTTAVADLFARANVDALANLLAKVALDHELRLGVPAARRYLHKALLDMCRAYRAATTAPYGMAGGGLALGGGPGAPGGGSASRAPPAMHAQPPPAAAPGGAGAPGDVANLLPEALQMLPLYVMGLQKSGLFRGGDAVRSDERAALVYRALSMPVAHSRGFIYPSLFSLHDLDPAAGRPDAAAEEGACRRGARARARRRRAPRPAAPPPTHAPAPPPPTHSPAQTPPPRGRAA